MAITSSTLALVDQQRTGLRTLTDAQTRDLTKAWVNAWDQVAPDLTTALLGLLTGGKVTRAQVLKSDQIRQAFASISDQLDDLAESSTTRITADLTTAASSAGASQAPIVDSQLPPQGRHLVDPQAWAKVADNAVASIVAQYSDQVAQTMKSMPSGVDALIRALVARGYDAGEDPRGVVSQIVGAGERRFNTGLTSALRTSSTQTHDAARDGARSGRMSLADVLAGWAWHCELSTDSCPACIAMDGQVFPLNSPGPVDHVNGRCTGVPIALSWTHLGLGGDEPASVRVAGPQWFAAQQEAVQRQILGSGRYIAWNAGRYPISAWGEIQHNDGWRPSLQNTPVPADS